MKHPVGMGMEGEHRIFPQYLKDPCFWDETYRCCEEKHGFLGHWSLKPSLSLGYLDLHQRVATLEIELEKEKKLHHAVPLEFEQRNRPVHVRPPNLISEQRTVYSTKTGQCWHADIHCQHLRSTVAKAGVLHLAPCSRCVH